MKKKYENLRIDNQLCFRLYSASRLITQTYKPMLDMLGITYPQYLVMMVLWETDNLPVNDIAKRLLLNTNTVTPLLKRMEESGIISRRRSKADERQVIVSLTAAGKSMREDAVNIPEEMKGKLTCGNLESKDLYSLMTALDNLMDALRSDPADGDPAQAG